MFRKLFKIDENAMEECEILENIDDEELETGKYSHKWNLKVKSLLQIMHYNAHHGSRKLFYILAYPCRQK